MIHGYPFNIRSEGQRSRSQGHKMQEHISSSSPAKFSMTPNGKTIDGTQKCRGPKMMAQTTSITMQNLMEIARRTSA